MQQDNNPQRIDAEKIAEIFRLRTQGLSSREVGDKVGCDKSTVLKYWRMADAPAEEEKPDPAETLYQQVKLLLLKSKNATYLEDLCNTFDVPPARIKAAIDRLSTEGFNTQAFEGGQVSIASHIPPEDPTLIDIRKFAGRKVRFGCTADNHLGSKYERMDVINALFDIWQDQGIETVYNMGNMIDGEASFNKFDIKVHGMQNQIDYFCEKWPQRKGMVTEFVTGDDHEGWYVQREGVNIGRMIQNCAREGGRHDLIYKGHMEHDIMLEGFDKRRPLIRLIHAGGGTAYALSYKPQQIINSYQGGEKPSILLIGHYHKAEFNYWREVLNLQVGCTEDQTPFMRKKSIPAHVGGWTVEFEVDDNGVVHRFRPEFHPFYDREFYRQWKYHY